MRQGSFTTTVTSAAGGGTRRWWASSSSIRRNPKSVLLWDFFIRVMQGITTAFFGLSFFSYGAALLAFLLVLFLFGIALGVAVFYPLSVLPGSSPATARRA